MAVSDRCPKLACGINNGIAWKVSRVRGLVDDCRSAHRCYVDSAFGDRGPSLDAPPSPPLRMTLKAIQACRDRTASFRQCLPTLAFRRRRVGIRERTAPDHPKLGRPRRLYPTGLLGGCQSSCLATEAAQAIKRDWPNVELDFERWPAPHRRGPTAAPEPYRLAPAGRPQRACPKRRYRQERAS